MYVILQKVIGTLCKHMQAAVNIFLVLPRNVLHKIHNLLHKIHNLQHKIQILLFKISTHRKISAYKIWAKSFFAAGSWESQFESR